MDKFGELVGMVGGRGAFRAHFVENDRDAGFGGLPGGLGAGESATNDVNVLRGGHGRTLVEFALRDNGWGALRRIIGVISEVMAVAKPAAAKLAAGSGGTRDE